MSWCEWHFALSSQNSGLFATDRSFGVGQFKSSTDHSVEFGSSLSVHYQSTFNKSNKPITVT